jgi:hypothetical protein
LRKLEQEKAEIRAVVAKKDLKEAAKQLRDVNRYRCKVEDRRAPNGRRPGGTAHQEKKALTAPVPDNLSSGKISCLSVAWMMLGGFHARRQYTSIHSHSQLDLASSSKA